MIKIKDPWFDDIHLKSQSYLEKTFLDSCLFSYPERIKYLLNSSKLKKKSNLQKLIDEGLCTAVDYGNLDIVKCLLISNELSIHANIKTRKNYPFRIACYRGYIEIVEFLTSSKELKEYPDLHALNDFAFYTAVQHEHKEIFKTPDI